MEKICTSYLDCKKNASVLFIKKGYPILECKKCGHRFVEIPDQENHLASIYSDDYFFAGKDGYPNYLQEKDLLYKQGLRYARIISRYMKPGRVLDVGSAAGFILKGFEHSGWKCSGVEPNETMAAYGRTHLELDIKTGSLEAFEANEKFDLINMIQVVGHVYDIDKALRNVSHLLKTDGLVLVESWNMHSAVARILGKRWHEYSPPSVVHWYSDKSLANLFKYYGFSLLDKGYPVKKINGEHALSFLEEKINNAVLKKMITAAKRAIGKFTIIYPLFDVKWYVFQKADVGFTQSKTETNESETKITTQKKQSIVG